MEELNDALEFSKKIEILTKENNDLKEDIKKLLLVVSFLKKILNGSCKEYSNKIIDDCLDNYLKDINEYEDSNN